MIVLKSESLEINFDEKTGAVRKVVDLRTGTVMAESCQTEAFILERGTNDFSSDFNKFTYTQELDRVEFCWQTEDGVSITCLAAVRDRDIVFSAKAEENEKFPLYSLEYPLINGIKSISGDQDFLAHSYATGFLIQNPYSAFEKEGNGLRYMPYPESFSGASMQFFTYYAKNLCGLYFAAEDGNFYQKWLNFYKSGNALRASQIFGYEDVGCGKPLEANWKFVMKATNGNDWYEACDIYKEWALKQIWCKRGRLKDRPEGERAAWLLENTGASTFGINGMYDRVKWIRKYREVVGKPIFHVTGPDWTCVPQTYGRGVPGGYSDWFPTRFCPENIEAWHDTGDHFAPFEFDFLVDPKKGDGNLLKENLQKWPEVPKSCDKYHLQMLCPICEYTQKLHVERDRQVIKETGADAMYYDISANNILKTCMNPDHGHPLGAGREMTESYRKIYQKTRNALCQDTGKYIPLGTEMINETLIDVLDFYQARSNAQPCSALELWPYHTLLRLNRAWVIPMFQYVYSGYTPLRMDGWGKLTAESGSLIYHTIAKTYLWGGLFEINSEYSPMEVIDGLGENSSEEHYCNLEPRNYLLDENVALYLKKFASLRTGKYGKYLSYGQMLREPEVKCEDFSFSYFQYNASENAAEQNSSGTITSKSVISAAYELEGEQVVFIANTTASPQNVSINLLMIADAPVWTVCRDYTNDDTQLKEVESQKLTNLKLRPYQLTVMQTARDKI